MTKKINKFSAVSFIGREYLILKLIRHGKRQKAVQKIKKLENTLISKRVLGSNLQGLAYTNFYQQAKKLVCPIYFVNHYRGNNRFLQKRDKEFIAMEKENNKIKNQNFVLDTNKKPLRHLALRNPTAHAANVLADWRQKKSVQASKVNKLEVVSNLNTNTNKSKQKKQPKKKQLNNQASTKGLAPGLNKKNIRIIRQEQNLQKIESFHPRISFLRVHNPRSLENRVHRLMADLLFTYRFKSFDDFSLDLWFLLSTNYPTVKSKKKLKKLYTKKQNSFKAHLNISLFQQQQRMMVRRKRFWINSKHNQKPNLNNFIKSKKLIIGRRRLNLRTIPPVFDYYKLPQEKFITYFNIHLKKNKEPFKGYFGYHLQKPLSLW